MQVATQVGLHLPKPHTLVAHIHKSASWHLILPPWLPQLHTWLVQPLT